MGATLGALIGANKSVPLQNSLALRLFPRVREGQLQILRFALDDSGVLFGAGVSCLLRTAKEGAKNG
jgi:hypothetical protein